MPGHSSDIDPAVPRRFEPMHRMNRMYRRQRHIYNGTRRYYLLGRDELIADLQPARGAKVLEIGCGTGRNLVQAARLYSEATFFGIDVSTEMLTSATSAVSRAGLADRIRVAQGDATAFDPQSLFGLRCFDRVMISYCLSMISDWHSVLHAAAACLKPGGRMHIVDFGEQERLPTVFRVLLRRWLGFFDVTPRSDLHHALSAMAEHRGFSLRFERPFGGYSQYAVLTLPLEPAPL